MKRLAVITLLLTLGATAQANPFRTRFVCVPEVAPDQLALEFRVRDRGQCAEGERYLEVRPQADGSVLLLPYVEGLRPEESRDLESYRRFHGAENKAPNDG